MNKIYKFGNEVIVHDPTPEMIPFLRYLNPDYRIESVQPPRDFVPKFQRLKKERIKTDRPLFEMHIEELESILDGTYRPQRGADLSFEYSKLDVLHALSLQNLSECRLCGRNCGVNRFMETGKCGLGAKAHHLAPFIHIAEEPVINPAIVVNMAGCALRCCYCIDHELWDVSGVPVSDPSTFWEKINSLQNQDVPINTLEFINPTESVPGVIELLRKAPEDFNRPIVFNCHLYGSERFYEIAKPITDVWLVDLRYGNDVCAKRLSGVDDYMKYAKLGLDTLLQNKVRVIVRILVLPGHGDCCHIPSIDILSKYRCSFILTILNQYVPENERLLLQSLKNRPDSNEVYLITSLAFENNLSNNEIW